MTRVDLSIRQETAVILQYLRGLQNDSLMVLRRQILVCQADFAGHTEQLVVATLSFLGPLVLCLEAWVQMDVLGVDWPRFIDHKAGTLANFIWSHHLGRDQSRIEDDLILDLVVFVVFPLVICHVLLAESSLADAVAGEEVEEFGIFVGFQ